MIRMLAIVFALVLALAGGVAGLIHLQILPDFTGVIRPMVVAQGEELPPPAPRVEPIFQHLTPFMIPVIRNGEIERSMYIGLRLRIQAGQDGQVKMHQARLHDAYMRLLYDLVPKQMERGDSLDLVEIKEKMQEVADRLVGVGVVEEVLYQAVFER